MTALLTLTTKYDVEELIFLMNLECTIQQEIACGFISIDTGEGHPWADCSLFLEGAASELFDKLEDSCAFVRLNTNKSYLHEIKLWDEKIHGVQPAKGVELAKKLQIGKRYLAHIFENES